MKVSRLILIASTALLLAACSEKSEINNPNPDDDNSGGTGTNPVDPNSFHFATPAHDQLELQREAPVSSYELRHAPEDIKE